MGGAGYESCCIHQKIRNKGKMVSMKFAAYHFSFTFANEMIVVVIFRIQKVSS
jgi:hypothetical protein